MSSGNVPSNGIIKFSNFLGSTFNKPLLSLAGTNTSTFNIFLNSANNWQSTVNTSITMPSGISSIYSINISFTISNVTNMSATTSIYCYRNSVSYEIAPNTSVTLVSSQQMYNVSTTLAYYIRNIPTSGSFNLLMYMYTFTNVSYNQSYTLSNILYQISYYK